ncbi:MAG TPA: hypothetical protein VGH19_05480 [Verrucomicrobiae bacterium]
MNSLTQSPPPLPGDVTTRVKAILRSHWLGFLFLIPFPVMLLIHRLLGYSDALMVATPPGEIAAHTYNLIMVLVFYFGLTAFIAQTMIVAVKERRWLLMKLGCLGLYIGVLLWA